MTDFPRDTATVTVGEVSYPVVVPFWETDYIQGHLMNTGSPYEIDMLQAMAAVLDRDSFVLDVGANIGNHSLFLANVVGCRVMCFEPNIELTEPIKRSIALAGIEDRLEVRQMGVGSAASRGHFAVFNPANLGSQKIAVDTESPGDFRVDTLDSLDLEHRVNAIKIDVEGMEIDVLLGAEDLINRDRPLMFVECQDETSFDQISAWMLDHDYVYVDTYNATPTHQFRHAPGAERRLSETLNAKVREAYALTQNLAQFRRDSMNAKLELKALQEDQKSGSVGTQTSAPKSTLLDTDFELLSATTAMANVRVEALQYLSDIEKLKGEIKELRTTNKELKGRVKGLQNGRLRRVVALARATRFTPHDLIRFPVRLMRILSNSPKGRVDFAKLAKPSETKGSNSAISSENPRSILTTQAETIPFDPQRLKTAASIASRSADGFVARLGDRQRLKIAAIVDDFTRRCFEDVCELTNIHAKSWNLELENAQPDLLFVESAWRGHNNAWYNTVPKLDEDLQNLLSRCRDRGIPTVFWCKEDPVHFHQFLRTAREFDYVFTTDSDCVPRYKDALGHERVFLLPFAAQPSVHNPVESGPPREDALSFAGAYYTRYPERMRDLDSLLDGASAVMPVTIFDRNHGTTRANHLFPEKFSEYIAGTLHPSQIDIAYKGYRFSLNLNSVKNSQTMFARRAYELLACGTVTISNYARGLKVMLGDLVPMTDSAHQTSQILAALREDVDAYDRLRLAGIRKVHHEHTFEERLRYLSSRISGTEYHFNRKKITVLSPVSSLGEAEHVVATVHRQQGVDPQLVLVSDSREVSELARDQGFGFVAIDSSDTISHVADPEAFAWTVMHPSDWHGDHYLLDLALAGGYCEAQVIGRRHVAEYSSDISWNGSKGAYRSTEGLTPRQAIVRLGALDAPTISEALHADESLLQPSTQFTIDRFDYCLNGANAAQSILDLVSSDLDIDQGCDVSAVLAGVEAVPSPALDRTVISPKVYHSKLIRTKGINTARVEGGVRVASALEPGTGKSRWTKTRIPLQDVLKDGLLNISLDTSQAAIVRPTVRYFDADGNKLKSPIYPANALTTVKPPEGSVSCEFGLRFNNSGTAIIHAWNLSPDRITAYTPNSTRRVLIVSTHYPTYEHPYRFGFLHSRLRNYAQHGLTPDVFLLNPSETAGFAEYDGIETRTGGAADLAAQIASGVYDTIAVHFLDARIWNVIKPFKETHRVRVWIHGSDIQPWWRRAFNYETPEKLEAAKPASDKRLALWREVFDNPPADFAVVAVSQQFIDEAQVDIERTIPPSDVHVVHNPIDTDLFTYVEKPESQRLKILSIRPYTSRTYANDLAVAAVLELSSEPWFDQLEFVFIGDGHLFESTTEPIRDLPNVTLRQGFLTQHEIADLHKEFGVFLVPTRMDSQGVSRDEAMSSGLVAITNDVAAVPEFVSSAEGYLAPDEDSAGLAAAIRDLYAHPDVFLEKSQAAAARVRAQSASSIVIPQEIALLGGVERKHRNSLVD